MNKSKKFIAFFAVIIIVFIVVFTIKSGFVEKQIYPMNYSEYVNEYADKYGVDRSLVYAVIKCESNFNRNAVSKADAKGLMQITDSAVKWVDYRMETEMDLPIDYFDPNTNIFYGTYCLKLLLNSFEDTDAAICAYNAGMGTVEKWLSSPQYSDDGITLKEIPYGETKIYLEKVKKSVEKYKELYNID